MKIKKSCPFCGRTTELTVDAKKYARYAAGEHVQQAFPELAPAQREVIINGCCYNCSEKIYNIPAPGHEEAFGKRLGSCSCCDMAVWEKDVKDGVFLCPSCGYNEYE